MLPNLHPCLHSFLSCSLCWFSRWPHSLLNWVLMSWLSIFMLRVMSWLLHPLTFPPTWEQEQITSRNPCRAVLTSDPLRHRLLLQEVLSRNIPNIADLSLHHCGRQKEGNATEKSPSLDCEPLKERTSISQYLECSGPPIRFCEIEVDKPLHLDF